SKTNERWNTAVSGRYSKKKQKYDEMLKCGASKDATEAFKRKPYSTIDMMEYLERNGVDTNGQVNTDRATKLEKGGKME
ncbi:MAG: hypothetical protein RRY06_05510, partial [Lachnospiraceae bacterium]